MGKKALPRNDDEDAMTGRIKSDFPKHTLESALRISRAIEEVNGGRPYPPTDIAIAINISPGSSDFRAIISSAHKYGVADGSYKSDRIALTPIGTRIVSPTASEDARAAEIEAALRPETFRRIFDHFVGKKLPDDVFFQNTLVREFGVPREHAARCAQLFVANVTAVGLTRQAATGVWLSADALNANAIPPLSAAPSSGALQTDAVPEASPPLYPSELRQTQQNGVKKSIFIGHGKNKRPLQQLEQILRHYGIPFKVATEEANQFRPISEKVAAVMHECGAAILIFTADEEFRSPNGDVIWRPSENVVHELGAASVLYGGRIIVFKEKTLNLPSNFSGIGYISFEQDRLDGEANSLFKELVAFGLVKITVG